MTLINRIAHVIEFAWNAKSDNLVYVLQGTPGYSDRALIHGVCYWQISLDTKMEICLCPFPGPVSHLTWVGESLFFLGGVSPNKCNSAGMIYRIQHDGHGPTSFAFGVDDCAKELRWVTGFLAVQSQKGPEDQIMVMNGSSTTVLYNDTYKITTWDILDLGDGKVILVIGRGSPSNPTEIYVIQDQDPRQLSHHGDAIAQLEIADAFARLFVAGAALYSFFSPEACRYNNPTEYVP